MYNFGSFDAFIVKPTIMPDFARNLLHYCEMGISHCSEPKHIDQIPRQMSCTVRVKEMKKKTTFCC